MTKIDIISGFLGAGKTTLIKKLIAEAFQGQKLVLIENEFGEVGIDGGFMQEAGIEVSEINSGCICCSLVGDFEEALKKVFETYHPDRIIIEPSGVAGLSDVIGAVSRIADGKEIVINSYITVADGTKYKMYMKNFGEFYKNQIESATAVVLSRTQNMAENRLETVINMIKEINPDATIITTPWDEIDGKVILSAMESRDAFIKNAFEEFKEHLNGDDDEHKHEHHHDEDDEYDHEHHHSEDEHEHHHHHHADDMFTSVGVETPKKFTEEKIASILSKLYQVGEYGIVLRAKGIVASEDGEWIHFDYVPDEQSIRRGPKDYTGKICVIGSQLNEDALKELFGI